MANPPPPTILRPIAEPQSEVKPWRAQNPPPHNRDPSTRRQSYEYKDLYDHCKMAKNVLGTCSVRSKFKTGYYLP